MAMNRIVLGVNALAIAANATFAVLNGVDGQWGNCAISASVAAIVVALTITTRRTISHGSRKTREDHRSAGALDPRTSPSADPGTVQRTRTGVEVPSERATEPITAWKVARLGVDRWGRGVELTSLNEGFKHPIEGTAECHRMFPGRAYDFHFRAPSLDCQCGFYAWKTRTQAIEFIGARPLALLQVELFGTVIQHEHGYRAEKQRVLGVYLDSRCYGFMCRKMAQIMVFSGPPAQGLPPSFMAYCADHTPSGENLNVCGIQDVANDLRCETRFADLGGAS